MNILRDLFQQTPDMIYRVGSTGNPLAFEVSFWTMAFCKDFMDAWRREGTGGLLSGLVLTLFGRQHVQLMVRMYNPFVQQEHVMCYLKEKCDDVRGGTKILDGDGFWTCKTRFLVRLREDLRLLGGVVHLGYRAGKGLPLLRGAANGVQKVRGLWTLERRM